MGLEEKTHHSIAPQEDALVTLERLKWDVPHSLQGRTFGSLDDLRDAFPSDTTHGDVRVQREGQLVLGEKFYFYARPTASPREQTFLPFIFVAYYCGHCDKIFAEVPHISSYKHIGLLAGSAGYQISCSHCDSQFENHPFMHS